MSSIIEISHWSFCVPAMGHNSTVSTESSSIIPCSHLVFPNLRPAPHKYVNLQGRNLSFFKLLYQSFSPSAVSEVELFSKTDWNNGNTKLTDFLLRCSTTSHFRGAEEEKKEESPIWWHRELSKRIPRLKKAGEMLKTNSLLTLPKRACVCSRRRCTRAYRGMSLVFYTSLSQCSLPLSTRPEGTQMTVVECLEGKNTSEPTTF